ncbi:hypothetical protein NSE01_09800 [Novosphingobium sediminis]|uniref:Uncharacterized protein n=1 Tax=Novosphingobium sediminis TaxID=707214 RepID=A0A512AHG0_9SPHN|nr:hypothetical protein NSE01_09800 [Novosphingobium sediminis]
MRIERGTFIGERQRAFVLDMSVVGPQQAGKDAHEAGLADAIGAGQLERIALMQFKPHAPEQEPVPAPTGKIIGSKTGRLHRCER